MFGALVIGIGLGIVFLSNQGTTGAPPPPPALHYIQQDNSDFIQQDGTSFFLEN